MTFITAFEGSIETNDFKFGLLMIVVDLILYTAVGAICEQLLQDDNKFYEPTRKVIDKEHGAEMVKVTKIYGSAGSKKAVDNVSLVFRRNQVTALLGRNGAGKSTIM